MSRSTSLNARQAQEDQQSAEIDVVLTVVEHPDFDGGILRICAYPATRLSVEPLLYGTYSTWHPEDAEDTSEVPFLFTIMEAVTPDEKDDAPSQASLVLELLDSDMGDTLTSTTYPATFHMAAVKASSPNLIEGEWLHMLLNDADIDSGRAALRFSTESIYNEPATANRMVKENFPGLHR